MTELRRPAKSSPAARLPILALLSILLLADCAGTDWGSDAERAKRETIVETALGQVGRPYRYGGNTPDGFDCSGLVEYSYAEAGISVPHNTSALRSAGSGVSLRRARPGDLLFYRFNYFSSSLHVAIYLRHNEMVHAPADGKLVSVIHIDQDPWASRFIGAASLIR